jgi:hypothetical protein
VVRLSRRCSAAAEWLVEVVVVAAACEADDDDGGGDGATATKAMPGEKNAVVATRASMDVSASHRTMINNIICHDDVVELWIHFGCGGLSTAPVVVSILGGKKEGQVLSPTVLVGVCKKRQSSHQTRGTYLRPTMVEVGCKRQSHPTRGR